MKLSIVVTALDDPALGNTLRSIRETAGDAPEIIVVDDCGHHYAAAGSVHQGATYIRNSHRIGVGPSRTIGVLHATGEYVLLCDPHMRFLPGWYEQALRRIEGRPKTLHCATCLGLDSENMDATKPKGTYYGATLQLFGEDANKRHAHQVLECVWNKTPPEDDAEICAPMGAAYFWPREWFLKLNPLAQLRSWGCDETAMCLKVWLAGGDIRLMRNVEIAHVFLRGNEKQPFKVPVGHIASNKLWIIYTMFPEDMWPWLLEKMLVVYAGGELTEAKKIIEQNWHLVEVERLRNKQLFVHDFRWLAEKFALNLPA